MSLKNSQNAENPMIMFKEQSNLLFKIAKNANFELEHVFFGHITEP